jgi:hypothetical protein
MRTRLLAASLAVLCLAPPLWADEAKKPEAKTYEVPYRMTNFNHVMVRAKINGKGPFNFIVDTGAPALFVSTAAAKKIGVQPDRKGWGTFDRFEIEGGVVIEKAKGRIEDPFQLEGMNGLGLAGVELHGMIGYTILARYKIEYDFTKTKMAWTPLDFDPPAPEALGGKAGSGELNAMGAIMKVLGSLLGKQPEPEVRPRPFLGAEFAQDTKGVVVKSVLDKGPAAAGGLKPGDRVTELYGRTVRETDDVGRYLGKLRPGDSTVVTVVRDGQEREITVKLGEGF